MSGKKLISTDVFNLIVRQCLTICRERGLALTRFAPPPLGEFLSQEILPLIGVGLETPQCGQHNLDSRWTAEDLNSATVECAALFEKHGFHIMENPLALDGIRRCLARTIQENYITCPPIEKDTDWAALVKGWRVTR